MNLRGSQRALPGLGQLDRAKAEAAMAAIDTCNRRFGRDAVIVAAAGIPQRREWSTKFEMRSQRYLTRLDELPTVTAA